MRIAFLFSGQGAQYPGMLQDLYQEEQVVRDVFDKADKALGRSISDLCFHGTQEDLNLTHNTQPCVLAADLAAGELLRSKGVVAEAVAGFSLGEYAALTFAGAIKQDDVFLIVQVRADAMQEAVPARQGAMAALIGKESNQAAEICEMVKSGYVIPANYNSPAQTVISGEAAAVDEAVSIAEERGITCMKLPVSAPFHCKLMRPAAEKLAELFKSKSFSYPAIPVYMNVDGEAIEDGSKVKDLLVQQAMSPVQWVKTLQNMREAGIDTFIECGPGRTLSGLVKKTLTGVNIYRVENLKTLNSTLEAVNK
ncbi:ACP S-malonyltransferase [Oribacterium sp. WCC10]|uniref:ACP S-malonyltransferase n=1 Tax=Oribacterium sp. WCC10 TaxID=1855343 RepID=UPI0008F06073|nr:ACP S-malonyltransferase [Oribacterium sp. WCC10]SFG65170.1 [acyl-carrier-protein] S-malonyltransferase [Oribacterium sp. WCC10]